MSLHQLTEHTFATVFPTHSEHSISIEEIEDDEIYSWLGDVGGVNYRPCGAVGKVLGGHDDSNNDDDDDFEYSEATLHVFADELNDTTVGKPIVRGPPTQDRFPTSPPQFGNHHDSTASMNKSRQIASMLYQSISEMLQSSHREMGILALDRVNKNIESLARAESVEARKMTLADLLAEGLRDLDEPEISRSTVPSCEPRSMAEQTLHRQQTDQIVNLLSDMFCKIEELNHTVERSDSKNDLRGSGAAGETKRFVAGTAPYDAESKSVSSSSSRKRQSSIFSDDSSITSWTTASPHPESPTKGRVAMFRLPTALKESSNEPKGPSRSPKMSKAKPSNPSPSAFGPAAKSFIHQKELDLSITLQDSFTSFCSNDTEDKTPKRPQRRGSCGGTQSDSVLDLNKDEDESRSGESKASHEAPRQTPMVTRSLDGGVVMGSHRPGSRRGADVQAALPQRQRSFDD